jgi:hypothetical protein
MSFSSPASTPYVGCVFSLSYPRLNAFGLKYEGSYANKAFKDTFAPGDCPYRGLFISPYPKPALRPLTTVPPEYSPH